MIVEVVRGRVERVRRVLRTSFGGVSTRINQGVSLIVLYEINSVNQLRLSRGTDCIY